MKRAIMEISKKMNEIGEIYVYNYSVITVISYHLGENIFETRQGKNYFASKDSDNRQMKIFDE